MSAVLDSKAYYLLRDGCEREEGPYTLDQLRDLWHLDKLCGSILYATEGMQGWEPLDRLQEILSERADRQNLEGLRPNLAPGCDAKLIACPDCGHQVSKSASACPSCGKPFAPPPIPHQPAPQIFYVTAAKSRSLYVVLGLFLGIFGIHNFYAGRNGEGAAQLFITLVGGYFIFPALIVLIWAFLEVLTVARDGYGQPMR